MCVEIIKDNDKISYNREESLDAQIKGPCEVVIDCTRDDCPNVNSFLEEVEHACKLGLSLPIKLNILNNDSLSLYKKAKKINKVLQANDIVHQIVKFQKVADDGLKELSEICLKGKNVR